MKLGLLDNLKPHNHTTKLVNNTELPLLCSVKLDVFNNSQLLTLLFYVTFINQPCVLLGNDGLSKLYPNWQFEQSYITREQVNMLERESSLTFIQLSISHLGKCSYIDQKLQENTDIKS